MHKPSAAGLSVAPLSVSDQRANESLRLTLESIPEDAYGPWWGTPAGRELLDEIRERVGGPVVRVVAQLYSVKYDADDVAHTAIDVLSRSAVRASVATADNGWGYLYRVLRREITHQVGPFFRVDAEIDYATAPDPADSFDSPYTDLRTAVALTAQVLVKHSPAAVADQLGTVVSYLAARSGDRLSRACTEITQDASLRGLGLTGAQLRAITNVVLGSRPRFADTSILGGFIRDAAWDPSTSPTHAAALRRFQNRMTPATNLTGLVALAS